MTTVPVDLTLEIRSEDGSSAEFFQDQESSVNRTLRLLATPQIFTQPFLVLASRHSVRAIPCRTIDMILASTSAPMLVRWPTGFLDLVEVPGHDSGAHAARRMRRAVILPSLRTPQYCTSMFTRSAVGSLLSRPKLWCNPPFTINACCSHACSTCPLCPFDWRPEGSGSSIPLKSPTSPRGCR